MTESSAASAPIGVFDSGIGGLSVLAALRQTLPRERFVYVADSGHAPYGERDTAHVLRRSKVLAHYLVQTHHVKALVLACNTATAAAVASLRAQYQNLPIVGIEPALKPAATQTKTGAIAVMATRVTLDSEKFQALLAAQPAHARFLLQACDGLAAAIEQADASAIEALCARYTVALRAQAVSGPQIDTVVLGCTHYALVSDVLKRTWGPDIALIDAGAAVARRAHQLLSALGQAPDGGGLQRTPEDHHWTHSKLKCYSTADADALARACVQWLPGASAQSVSDLSLP